MDLINDLVRRVLNHLLQAESWASARLAAHSGAQVLIEAGPLALRLLIDGHGQFQAGDEAAAPDVRITLPSDVPLRFLLDRNSLFTSVKLGGSADIAESLAFVLRNLRWDAEADLAEWVGDIPAHRLARLARSLAQSIQVALGRAVENFSEYAVEEARLITPREVLVGFAQGVNQLRDDLARLEKRIARLPS